MIEEMHAQHKAVAADLRTWALLHDRELDRETLEALRDGPAQGCLGLILRSEAARRALDLLDSALAELPAQIDPNTLDDLAAEYANIYLTYAYRASPNESVWFDDDGLERQEAMFALRKVYRRHGLMAREWSKRSEDHLVLQLEFLAHVFEAVPPLEAGTLAADFLDRHLLTWVGQFAGRVEERSASSVYVGLLLATAAYLEELRDLLAETTGQERATLPAESRQDGRSANETDQARSDEAYLPGAGPGW
jgi:TorA maturation chaperone TorD